MFSTHRRGLAASGFLLLIALSGCGSDAGDPAVASAASGPAPAASPKGDAITRYVDAQRQWVACMRKEGYNVPDPDAKGFVDLGAFLAAAKMPKTDPGFTAAQQQCASVRATVPAELLPSQPPLTPQQLENRRKYARCMRENGMTGWPDPGADGEFPADKVGEMTTAEQADNIRALQICDPVLDGRPPTTPNPNDVPQG